MHKYKSSSGAKSAKNNARNRSAIHPPKNVGLPHLASPLARQFWTGYYTRTHTRRKKKLREQEFRKWTASIEDFQRIKDVFPACALFRAAVPRDFTCRVLSRDKGLSAERLSARYPAGNTYQAALQVWQKIRRKKNIQEISDRKMSAVCKDDSFS